MSEFLPRPASRWLRAVGLASALVLAGGSLQAQDSNDQPQVSERTSAELQKLQPLLDAKNWDGAFSILNALRATVPPTSYDYALISDIIGKIFLQKGDYGKAIEPLETSLRLGDTKNYFEPKARLETVYFLVQLYYQAAVEKGVSTAVQEQNFAKALSYLERWLRETPKKTDEAIGLYANLLYNRAVANPDHPDKALLEKAKQQCWEGLRLATRPKDQFYVLLLACMQQEGDFAGSAEVLELLVKRAPTNKAYWQQLAGTYLNLSADKNPRRAFEFSIRAIVTIERAQALGIMNTPKDNYNLVSIYFNIGQYGKATELLAKGLRDGSIENEQKNWELLAYSLQQINQEYSAIDALKEAAKRFPKAGQIDFQIAQIYYSLDKGKDAYRHLVLATRKGNLEKPGAAYGFLAYIAFDLKLFDEALQAADKAMTFPDARNDKQLPQLRKAVEDAIKERDAAKNPAPQSA